MHIPPLHLQAPKDRGPEEAAPRGLEEIAPPAAVPGGATAADVGAGWLERHGWMVAYMAANGGALPVHMHRIPEGEPGGGFALGSWVADRKQGRGVTDARRAVLDATEGWSWARQKPEFAEAREAHWDAVRASAVRYFVEHGERWPPASCKDPVTGSHVGGWVHNQREQYKADDPRRRLSPARIAKLEATPGWTWAAEGGMLAADRGAHWDAMLAKAVSYHVENGQKWPPMSYKDPVDGSRIGCWVHNQRALYKGTLPGQPLPPARIAKLQATPGWLWEARAVVPAAGREAHWDAMLAKAVRYFGEHGEKWPPAGYRDPVDGSRVGIWVVTQRQLYKGNHPGESLSPARVAKLEATPGWLWEAHPRLRSE